MNILPIEKQVQIISALVEGNSVRATARMVGVEHKTVLRVLLRVGKKCEALLNEKMQRVPSRLLQVDEVWTFVGKKEKRLNGHDNHSEMGDQYIFLALDAQSKLVPCFMVGKRTAVTAHDFMQELQSRLSYRVQLTTDGFKPYLTAVESAFGADIDYAMLVKLFSGDESSRERYSPSEIIDARPVPVSGNPNLRHISTSYVERQNLTLRMQLRRLTRLTNAFSKKLENLKAALSLHFAWYNFCRIHASLRVTPAMAAGITSEVWNLAHLLG
jgi:IS1 family transposase